MKMFKKDFKENIKSALIWTTSASAMAFLQVSVYQSMIAGSAESWNEMMKTMPQAMLDAFKITEMTFDNILSYYAMEGFLFVALLLSIFTALLGARLINKEESDQTVEFALTKPISRFKYVSEKLLTLIVMTTSVNVILNIILYIGMLIGSTEAIDMNGFMLYALGTYLITLSFGLIAFMSACILKRSNGLSGLAIGAVFASFFLGILANVSDKLINLKYLSLFEYINPLEILEKGIPLLSIIVFTIIIIGSILISYRVYLIKDIYN